MSLFGVPRLPRELIARPRLTARLEGDSPLVVLHAPMGYGKTVAMAQWARSTPRRGMWLRMREGNGDPRPFVQQLAADLDDFGLLDIGNPLATASETLTVDDDPWSLLTRGLRRLGGDLVLAIDEADRLSDATADGLLRLLHDLPLLSVRTALRRASGFTEPALTVVGDIDVLGTADLALTGEEAQAIVGDQARAAELRAAGGAPALARMMVLSDVVPRADRAAPSLQQTAESLLRLRSGPWQPDVTAFLRRVAVADAIDVAFAAELTGRDDAASLLDAAEREGLGSWSTPAPRSGEQLFVFSPFFRLAAEAHLTRERSRAEVREIVRRVARWELSRGMAFPALRRGVELADWDLVDDVLRAHWNELLSYGARLTDVFRGVPVLTLRSRPLAAIVLALVANANGAQRLRALEYFALAAYGARTQRTRARPADRVLLRAIETAAQRVSGRHGAIAAALEAYESLATMDAAERDLLGRNEPTVYNQVGTTLFYFEYPAKAVDAFRHAAAAADARGLKSGLQSIALTAGALAATGDLIGAREALAEADRRAWPDRWVDGYPGSFAQLARGILALEALDASAAEAAIRTLDAHRATIEHWPLLLDVDVLVLLLRRRPADAAAMIESTIARQRVIPSHRSRSPDCATCDRSSPSSRGTPPRPRRFSRKRPKG